MTTSGAGNGGSLWRSVGPANKSPPQKTSTSTGFGFFSKDDMKAGDKSASISTAFKKYVESCFVLPFRCFPSLSFVLLAVFNDYHHSLKCV